jgi:hypothetical protein
MAGARLSGSWLRRFFLRDDALYKRYESTYQAKTASAKIMYFILGLLPGLVAYLLLDIGPLFRAQLALTHLSPKNLQYAWLIIFTFGWHMFLPLLLLRYADKLTLRESFAFLGLSRVDWRGLFLVLPVFCGIFALISMPYMKFVFTPLHNWLQSVQLFRQPPYSIFQNIPDNIYSFSPFALFFLFVGNFLGEELYFRGYLMKKTAFLGGWNWTANSLLFAAYHLWQIPQTWPLAGLVLAFGLLMWLRKDLYVMVIFHLFLNMWLVYYHP